MPRKRDSSRLQIVHRCAGLLSSSLPSAPRFIAFPNNRSPLTSNHLEPPSTACPYTGTAQTGLAAKSQRFTDIRTAMNTRRCYSPPKNAAASSNRSDTHKLTTKQRAPRSQKRAGAETTLRTAWIKRLSFSGFCSNNPSAGGGSK